MRDIHKIEKKNSINISVLGYENREKNPIYVSKKWCEDKHMDLLLIDKTHILLKILIRSCMIIHYPQEENIFVVIVYELSLQKKQNVTLKIALN